MQYFLNNVSSVGVIMQLHQVWSLSNNKCIIEKKIETVYGLVFFLNI